MRTTFIGCMAIKVCQRFRVVFITTEGKAGLFMGLRVQTDTYFQITS